uniref:Uncharacterized protein n=1 Tax=Panagrellus redivivus TaxID=6233 RepID=A0A7E4W7J1_PANRE
MSSKQFRRGSKELIGFNPQHVPPNPNPNKQQSPMTDTSEPCSSTDSVHSFCDQIQGMDISSLVTAVETTPRTNNRGTNTRRDDFSESGTGGTQTVPLELRSAGAPLFDYRHPDLINAFEENSDTPHSVGSTTFHPTRIVHTVRMHGKLPSFEKHSERIVPNPWRRYGVRAKLSAIGGWANQRKHSASREVKQNGPCPRAPNTPQMGLHRDVNPPDGRLPIHFDIPNRTVPGNIAAMQLAVQLADRVEASWRNEPWFDKKYSHMDTIADTLYLAQEAEKRAASKARTSTNSTASCGTAISGYFTTSSGSTGSCSGTSTMGSTSMSGSGTTMTSSSGSGMNTTASNVSSKRMTRRK